MMYNPHHYRVRNIDSVIGEIKSKIAQSDCRRFMFVDNYFGGNREHAKCLVRRIIAEGIEFRCFSFCRLEVYKDPEFLSLLKQANFDPLFIGFESFNDSTLQSFDKRQTAQRIIESIKVIKGHGLRISGSFIIGSDEDTVASIRESMDAARRYGIDNINIFPLSAMPTRQPQTIPRRRMIMLDYDFGSGNHVAIFPKQMKPSTLQKEYIRAYRLFNNPGRTLEAIRSGSLQAGLERLLGALAHREIIADIENRYLPQLVEIEKGYYDSNERLIEDRLPPEGIINKEAILAPEEEPAYDVALQHDPAMASIFGYDGRQAHLTSGAMIGEDTTSEMVRKHTLEMALRKCYGNLLS